jgi:chloramphenicol-sensitive protein RarD
MSNVPEPHRRSEVAQGVFYGAFAYIGWGLAPLFWQLLHPAGAPEILADRVIWSFVLLAPLVYFQGRMPHVRTALADRRKRTLLFIAALLIGGNWFLFIWATMNGHILDTSLGYFSTPLFSTALGYFFLKERLRPLQWVAIAIAGLAVLYITIEHRAFPWIGIALASSFALYGFVKKLAGVDAIESLVIETAYLSPVALIFLGYWSITGTNTFGEHGISHALLMASCGVITAVPLLLYGAAVVRAPLMYIGFLQYISSSIQFFVGIYIFHETMNFTRFMGFAITWSALVVLAVDAQRARRMPAHEVTEFD